jgi:hypothetical protein
MMFDKTKLYKYLTDCREICKAEDQRNSATIYHSIIKKIDEGHFDCGCPMTADVPLTIQQVKRFCALGCSVDCPELLKRYIAAAAKVKKEKHDEMVLNRRKSRCGR